MATKTTTAVSAMTISTATAMTAAADDDGGHAGQGKDYCHVDDCGGHETVNLFRRVTLVALGGRGGRATATLTSAFFFSRFFSSKICENIRAGLADLFGLV